MLFGAILSALHLLGALVIGIVPLSWALRLGLWLMLSASLLQTLRTHALRRGPRAIRALEFTEDDPDTVRVRREQGWETYRILGHFVHPQCTVLSLRSVERRWSEGLVIVPDAIDRDEFRRLRTRLKWQR